MILLFITQLMRRWYYAILFPVLMEPLFYVLVALWIVLTISMTYIFFNIVDKARLYYVQQKMVVAVVKSSVIGLFFSTLLLALVGLCFAHMSESDFFIRQRDVLSILNVMTMPHLAGFSVTLNILIILFLFFSQYYVLEYISDLSYQLYYPKNWWIYFGLSTFISVFCYVMVMLFGYL